MPAPGPGETAKLCRISGKVQNVWYRAWTIEQAQARELRGWVRNRVDGTVEALFAGPADQVAAMIALCYTGPKAARVSEVATEDFTGEVPGDFHKLRDA
ncbi:MAG: acylphosphatase [Rhodospirillaceae bacterium]|nr:acylphosphatase [Rhodospirillaceae bacterium]